MFIFYTTYLKKFFFRCSSLVFMPFFFKLFSYKPVFILKKLYLEGLGFRTFIFKNSLFLSLGMSHLYKISIPLSIFIIRKRRSLLFFGPRSNEFFTFYTKILNLRKIPRYKPKSFFPLKDWDLVIRPRILPQSQR